VRWLLLATAGDVVAVSALAVGGVLMTSVSLGYVLLALGVAVAFMFVMDPVKVVALRRFNLAHDGAPRAAGSRTRASIAPVDAGGSAAGVTKSGHGSPASASAATSVGLGAGR